jgi:hypothetical protein
MVFKSSKFLKANMKTVEAKKGKKKRDIASLNNMRSKRKANTRVLSKSPTKGFKRKPQKKILNLRADSDQLEEDVGDSSVYPSQMDSRNRESHFKKKSKPEKLKKSSKKKPVKKPEVISSSDSESYLSDQKKPSDYERSSDEEGDESVINLSPIRKVKADAKQSSPREKSSSINFDESVDASSDSEEAE